MSPLAQHLFSTGVSMLPTVPKCFDCSEPGTNLVLGHPWCNDCLAKLNEELDAFHRHTTAEQDELGRLAGVIRHDFRGRPGEL